MTPGPLSLVHIPFTSGHGPLNLNTSGVLSPTTESATTLGLLGIANGNEQYGNWNPGHTDDGGNPWMNGMDFGQVGIGIGSGCRSGGEIEINAETVGNVGGMFDPFWGIHDTGGGGGGGCRSERD